MNPTLTADGLQTLGVEADEAVFLDDIASNLKPASRMGISTIKVNDVTSALGELQTLLQVDLGVTAGTSRIRRGMEIDQASLERYLADKLNISGETILDCPYGCSICSSV